MEGITLYSTLYYKRSVFKGSYKGVNFHIEKSGEEENLQLKATVWKGPFILEKTKEEIFTKEFEFSDEGIEQAGNWVVEQQKILCL